MRAAAGPPPARVTAGWFSVGQIMGPEQRAGDHRGLPCALFVNFARARGLVTRILIGVADGIVILWLALVAVLWRVRRRLDLGTLREGGPDTAGPAAAPQASGRR